MKNISVSPNQLCALKKGNPTEFSRFLVFPQPQLVLVKQFLLAFAEIHIKSWDSVVKRSWGEIWCQYAIPPRLVLSEWRKGMKWESLSTVKTTSASLLSQNKSQLSKRLGYQKSFRKPYLQINYLIAKCLSIIILMHIYFDIENIRISIFPKHVDALCRIETIL